MLGHNWTPIYLYDMHMLDNIWRIQKINAEMNIFMKSLSIVQLMRSESPNWEEKFKEMILLNLTKNNDSNSDNNINARQVCNVRTCGSWDAVDFTSVISMFKHCCYRLESPSDCVSHSKEVHFFPSANFASIFENLIEIDELAS